MAGGDAYYYFCGGVCGRCPSALAATMSAGAGEGGFTKRAAQELSRCFQGLRAAKQGAVPRRRAFLARVPHARSLVELWLEPAFLVRLFRHVAPRERAVLAQVCTAWREVIYQPKFWRHLRPVLHFRDLRPSPPQMRLGVYRSLDRRGVDTFAVVGAADGDAFELAASLPQAARLRMRALSVRCSSLTDAGLEALLAALPGVAALELTGCNDVTEAGLRASLTPRVVQLQLSDCVQVADETVACVARLLPSLYELDLQAYHVTDAAMASFGGARGRCLRVLRLRSCWELTDRGLAVLARTLPRLVQLSLSGCSRVSDEGVALLASQLRQLRALDLGWCPRLSDAALECIAAELDQLEELTLDRCVHVTDVGLGHLSTMGSLCVLYLRWCTQIRDCGLRHICSMRGLQVLSLAGCSMLTASGLSMLSELPHLQELELTNCRALTPELTAYLRERLPPDCLLVD